jgi:hypothetical protein
MFATFGLTLGEGCHQLDRRMEGVPRQLFN